LTLTEFLLARLAEDEEVAREASADPWTHVHEGLQGGEVIRAGAVRVARVYANTWSNGYVPDCENAAHIARHDPARVLAEVEAKRAVVAERLFYDRDPDYELTILGERILAALALPYAGHPDYQPEWSL
jgi:hypothetical protein